MTRTLYINPAYAGNLVPWDAVSFFVRRPANDVLDFEQIYIEASLQNSDCATAFCDAIRVLNRITRLQGDPTTHGLLMQAIEVLETAGARVARHVAKSRVDHEILSHKNSLAEGWIFQ